MTVAAESPNFGDRSLLAAAETSPLVIGLDPRAPDIPRFAWDGKPGHRSMPEAILNWNMAIIQGVAGLVPAIKPQSAFYEVLGADGWLVLSKTVEYAREHGLLVILDAKRADIGATAAAYAAATLGGDCLDADAVTVNAYFGVDGIAPFLRLTDMTNKGLYVVVHTSNPSAAAMQDVRLRDGRRYFELVADLVAELGRSSIGPDMGYSSVGAVVAGTYPEQLSYLRRRVPSVPFLVPGFGHQGATAEDVAAGFDDAGTGALVSSSRAMVDSPPSHIWRDREAYTAWIGDRTRTVANSIRAAVAARAR